MVDLPEPPHPPSTSRRGDGPYRRLVPPQIRLTVSTIVAKYFATQSYHARPGLMICCTHTGSTAVIDVLIDVGGATGNPAVANREHQRPGIYIN